jgi:Zn finger protein HypA/HybF involved in hydrogenase expression
VVKAVFPCGLCPDTSFATKARLTTHMKKKHANKDPIPSPTVMSEVSYKCQHCPDIFFGTEAELFEHLNRSHYNMTMAIPIQAVQTKAPNRMKYYCPHCSHATSSRDMLTNHMLIHTKQVINFDCNLCGKKFLNATDFKVHISEAHSK